MRPLHAVVSIAIVAAVTTASLAQAPVSPEQRKELAAISQQVGDASKLLRKKELDEAETSIDDAETKLKALLDGGVPETERLVSIIQRNIALRRRAIALQRGEKPGNLGVSFSDDIAPIITAQCLNCHGANPKGGLRLDTFEGWEKGGASKQPLGAVLLPRLTTPNDQQRMPKGQPPLTQFQLESIARWIKEGAKFDGRGKDAPIGEKAAEGDDEEKTMPAIGKPSGGETVSFVNDVAPFMVNICGQCHIGNNPRGGFNIATFEGVMKGGESGQVIEPGDADASQLWRMVSNKEQPRMPPGQLRITRENYDALTTWIKEGAKFDGDDPKKPLRDLVPSTDQMRAKELAKLSDEDFLAHRREKSDAHFKKALPKEQPATVETEQYLVYGNVPEDRLKQVAGWADEQAASLRSMFSAKDSPLWKGKLTVFVMKDRFSYEEFAIAVNDRSQVPQEVHGHAIVSPDFEDAYIAVEDVGDDASADNAGLKSNLANYLTQAYVLRGGSKAPNWVVQGTGLYVAAKSDAQNPYFSGLRSLAGDAAGAVTSPDKLFTDGTFAPATAAAVGYALVDFLISQGGPAKFALFVQRISESGDPAASIQNVYRTTPAALAAAFAQNLALRGK